MKKTEARMRRKMERELTNVNRWLSALKREPRPEEWEAGGDNTPLSEDADAMQVGEEREIRAELLGHLIERTARLDEALRRIREGTYGTCARCEGPIHPERLEALPESPYCLECQKRLEAAAPAAEPTPEEWLEAEEIYQQKIEFE